MLFYYWFEYYSAIPRFLLNFPRVFYTSSVLVISCPLSLWACHPMRFFFFFNVFCLSSYLPSLYWHNFMGDPIFFNFQYFLTKFGNSRILMLNCKTEGTLFLFTLFHLPGRKALVIILHAIALLFLISWVLTVFSWPFLKVCKYLKQRKKLLCVG